MPPDGNANLETDAPEGVQLQALQEVLRALHPLPADAQRRILDSVSTFLGLETRRSSSVARNEVSTSSSGPQYPPFSADTSMSPKEFLMQKQPRTDVERIACLSYYLTHYRDSPHFKTLDLSKLNTEAAQPKFSNAATSANNAVKRGYLVPSTKGHRQLSAPGELFVEALPDRDAARQVMASIPRRKARRSTASKKKTTAGEKNG